MKKKREREREREREKERERQIELGGHMATVFDLLSPPFICQKSENP